MFSFTLLYVSCCLYRVNLIFKNIKNNFLCLLVFLSNRPRHVVCIFK